MSNQHSSEKAGLLWAIGPVAVLLTLLFVSVNNNTTGPKNRLMGDHGAEVKKENVAAAHDSTHAVQDTTHHAKAEETHPATETEKK
jgi:hypothetical protein